MLKVLKKHKKISVFLPIVMFNARIKWGSFPYGIKFIKNRKKIQADE